MKNLPPNTTKETTLLRRVISRVEREGFLPIGFQCRDDSKAQFSEQILERSDWFVLPPGKTLSAVGHSDVYFRPTELFIASYDCSGDVLLEDIRVGLISLSMGPGSLPIEVFSNRLEGIPLKFPVIVPSIRVSLFFSNLSNEIRRVKPFLKGVMIDEYVQDETVISSEKE